MFITEIFKPGRIKSGQIDYIPSARISEIADFIENKCKIVLALYKETNHILYRGNGFSLESDESIFIGKPRLDRRPKDTHSAIQVKLDRKLKAAGFIARRGNSLFVTSNELRARSYGRKYAIFPIDGFKYTWTPQASDLTSEFNLYNNGEYNQFTRDLQNLNAVTFTKKYEFKNSIDLISPLYSGVEIYVRGSYVAIDADSSLFQYVISKLLPSGAITINRIVASGKFIENVSNPTNIMIQAAISTYPEAFKLYTNPTDEIKWTALRLNSDTIEYISDATEEMKEYAIVDNASLIQYIVNPSEKCQLLSITYNGSYIRFFINQYQCKVSEKVKLAAVKQNAFAIQYIKNPSKEIQLAAVNKNPEAIQYIQNPCEEAQLIAVEDSRSNFKYINNPCEKATQLFHQMNWEK